jgi:hypothetical protein
MKTIKNRFRVVVAFALVTMGVSAKSFADDAINTGTACQPAAGAWVPDINSTQNGATNVSGGQRNVACPMPRHSLPLGATINTARLAYSDNSTSSEFMCAFFACSWTTGACGWTSTKWTCTTAGGCSSGTSASSGILGNLSWTGLSLATNGNNGFSCTMAGDSGGGPSTILSYRIIY